MRVVIILVLSIVIGVSIYVFNDKADLILCLSGGDKNAKIFIDDIFIFEQGTDKSYLFLIDRKNRDSSCYQIKVKSNAKHYVKVLGTKEIYRQIEIKGEEYLSINLNN